MIEREEVAGWLEHANDGYTLRLMPDELAELARTWLRVNDAPVGVVEADDSNSLDRPLTWTPMVIPVTDILTEGQRVRLVPEADSGGDRG